MLTPEQMQLLPLEMMAYYQELNEFILSDIARRIAKGAKITETAEFQIYRAKALGLSTKAIENKISAINKTAKAETEKLFMEYAKLSDEFDREVLHKTVTDGLPLDQNRELMQLIDAQVKQMGAELENITKTLGFAEIVNGKVVYSSCRDMFVKQLDAAHLKVASGATDFYTALRAAVAKLSESGVRTVNYASGRSDRVDVAVRRALMTGTSQVVQKISEQNGQQFGADGWEISAHAGARPSHAMYQGKQYPNSKYETIVRPLIEDYNCRHSAYPIIIGVSTPMYTAKELKNIDPPPFTYDGQTYTAYEATQQQRKMERAMRKQKNRCVCADADGDKEQFTTSSIKLRRQREIYKDFSQKAGLYTQFERTQVYGYNKIISGKSVFEVDKYKNFFYYKDGHIRVTDDWKDQLRPTIPKKYRPFAVIETQTKSPKTGKCEIDRSFYDENGSLSRQSHSSHHGKPKTHLFGKNGEHHHYYSWDDEGNLLNKTTDELTDFEREESADIL